MISLSDIENLIQHIWEEPIFSDVTSKKVVVSLYGTLSKKIPDKFIIIEEVFPKDELEDIWSNYEEYLDEYLIFP
ncbi:SMI1/KNR4 family protein, partial [Vibrio parahaemolyticus]